MLPDQEEFFDRLYREYFWKLKRYSLLYLNESQAEEIVQDAFHEAVEKIDSLYIHENPGGWLMNTLKNKIRNCQRTNRRDLLRLVSLDAEPAMQAAAPGNAEDRMEQQEALASASERIGQALSPDELYLLRRIAYGNASHKEVAAELGISVWASQKRLERIRDKLDKLFPGYRRRK